MSTYTEQGLLEAGKYLKKLGIEGVIITAGEKGSYLINDDGEFHISANVKAVDTTVAGYSFIASFAVAKAKGLDDEEAAHFASKVAAVVVRKEGRSTIFIQNLYSTSQ